MKTDSQTDWEKSFETQFGFLHQFVERWLVNNPQPSHIVNWGDEIKKFVHQELSHQATEIHGSYESKLNMIQLGIDVFFESEKQRSEDEKRGVIKRDGGPTMAAFGLLKRIKEELSNAKHYRK